MTIQEMKTRKRELGYSNRELSALSGVPEATIQKIFSGRTSSPRKETLDKLREVLMPEYTAADLKPPMVAEAPADYGGFNGNTAGNIWKNQGSYTLKDYLALPDEQRVELIDGVFYDMSAPTTVHQAVGGYIYKLLLDHVLSKGGLCFPFMSPVDVQLDEDDRTVVQPDVLIICDRSKFRNGRVFGAPDFLAEVLSPSTRKKDMYLKLWKYKNAGVREYWIIDPQEKQILVYDLENDSLPQHYTFADTVPVGIWHGECMVDFAAMDALISFLYY